MSAFAWNRSSNTRSNCSKSLQTRQNKMQKQWRRGVFFESLDPRTVLAAIPGVPTPHEVIQSGYSATQLAESLVGPGLSINNATFTGGASAAGSFTFTDPTVIGFGQGIVLSSGNVADVVGVNVADSTSTDFMNPGDADLTKLSGYDTQDAAVLEFDFVPTANQVVFQYSFASDEYPEWVNTPFNDVFAFYVNGINYATVRQIAGAPNSPFVPVAVNNINDGNTLYPEFVAARPDLFRPNYVNPNGGPSALDLEYDGITHVLTFQAPVTPGVTNHMKLAIADASDGVYDSAVFIQAGSLVSNENPVADLSLLPLTVADPSKVTAIIEGEDPNGLALTYTINWGDGTTTNGPLHSPTNESEKTATADHIYATGGDYIVTLTVSNGSASGTSSEDVHIGGGGGGGGGGGTTSAPVVLSNPTDQSVVEGNTFVFTASATGSPVPDVQWQVSTDGGLNFVDVLGATTTTYVGVANLTDDGSLYQALFVNDEGEAVTTAALLTVSPYVPVDVTPPDAPVVSLAYDSGASDTDLVTSLGGLDDNATVEYSVDGGNSWALDFVPVEGQNSVAVRQVDEAGNASDAALIDYLLDSEAPLPIDMSLLADTGSSALDHITNNGALQLGGAETDAVVEYFIDGGINWTANFAAAEGHNSVQARQSDLAGNVSGEALFDFEVDTTPPQLAPTFSSGTQPILVNAQGVTVSPNATDAAGIASQLAGVVNTATAGKKLVTCTATDVAGNTSSVSLSYVVGYAAVNVAPQSGATFKKTSSIPVKFQLKDANGLISDAMAANLASKVVITVDNQSFSGVVYNKKTHTFSLSLKASNFTVGTHLLGIHVFSGGDEVTTVNMSVKIV
jgi:hypothetical protein